MQKAGGNNDPGIHLARGRRHTGGPRVSTYGEVAKLAGLPRGARQVGRALGKAPASRKLPWYRVIAAGGRIAFASVLGRVPQHKSASCGPRASSVDEGARAPAGLSVGSRIWMNSCGGHPDGACMSVVCFSHGQESGPWGTKIRALADVARDCRSRRRVPRLPGHGRSAGPRAQADRLVPRADGASDPCRQQHGRLRGPGGRERGGRGRPFPAWRRRSTCRATRQSRCRRRLPAASPSCTAGTMMWLPWSGSTRYGESRRRARGAGAGRSPAGG